MGSVSITTTAQFGLGGLVCVLVVKWGKTLTSLWGSSLLRGVRRCPTLPHPPGCSTIGAVGLSFRVRDGSGRFPHAMAAVTLFGWPSHTLGGYVWVAILFYFFVKPVVVSEPRKNPGLVCCFGAVWWTRQ